MIQCFVTWAQLPTDCAVSADLHALEPGLGDDALSMSWVLRRWQKGPSLFSAKETFGFVDSDSEPSVLFGRGVSRWFLLKGR